MAAVSNQEEIPVSSPRSEAKEIRNLTTGLQSLDEFFRHMSPNRWLPEPWDWPWWQGLRKVMESSRMPAIDVIDFDQEIKVRVEVPGVEKKNLKVSFTDDNLTIQGSVSSSRETMEGLIRRCEICTGEFERSIPLSGGLDHEKATASLRDGVLEITLPKSNGARRHSIKLS